jgi:hypothetical protein
LLTGLLALGGAWLAYASSPVSGAGESLPGAGQAGVVPMAPGVITTAVPAPLAVNLIANGGFEDGFQDGVGLGWSAFANGSGQAGWYDDTWPPVVYQGAHAQLISLKDVQVRDRYVGIFQTVAVVPNTAYLLTLHGLVRSDPASVIESNYGYRMQFGIDFRGGADWQSVDVMWFELLWDEQPRTALPLPAGYQFGTYTATIRTQSDRVTLFIRGWTKWPGPWEANYDVDDISLVAYQ